MVGGFASAGLACRLKLGAGANAERLSRLKWFLATVKEHQQAQSDWVNSLHPETAAVAGEKKIPAFKHILQLLGYGNMDDLDAWTHGVSTVGPQTHSEGVGFSRRPYGLGSRQRY